MFFFFTKTAAALPRISGFNNNNGGCGSNTLGNIGESIKRIRTGHRRQDSLQESIFRWVREFFENLGGVTRNVLLFLRTRALGNCLNGTKTMGLFDKYWEETGENRVNTVLKQGCLSRCFVSFLSTSWHTSCIFVYDIQIHKNADRYQKHFRIGYWIEISKNFPGSTNSTYYRVLSIPFHIIYFIN